MDNVCHTLAGAVLAEAGLRRRTPLAVPTLLIGANLPDIDALAYLRDPLFALTVRRGWTHGLLAVAVLPVLLAGAMLAWERLARRNGDVVLAIADEGDGVNGVPTGTGLSIVRALVRDELQGSFDLTGSRAEVVFPR